MNLETLLEAAKFLELQDERKALGPTHTREEYATVAVKQEAANHEVTLGDGRELKRERSSAGSYRERDATEDHHTYHKDRDNGRMGQDDAPELRRRAGAGTREVHNKLEKNRRAHLKECFELVRKQLPASQEDKKASNLNILHSAIRYIQALHRKEREYEHEMERLAREKIALQQRFNSLKREISALWDYDFNGLVPETGEGVTLHSQISKRDEPKTSPGVPDEEALQRRGLVFATSPKHAVHEQAKMISIPNHGQLKTKLPQRPPSEPSPPQGHGKPLVNAVSAVSAVSVHPGTHIAATLVSPTIQLVGGPQLRMLPGDQPLALSLSHGSSVTPGGVALVSSGLHKPGASDVTPEALSLMSANGMRGKPHHHSIGLAIQNGTLAPGLTAKNGTIYKQHTQVTDGSTMLGPGITHVVAPLATGHGTLVTPMPVTVVPQDSQVAHILTATTTQLGTKMMTPLSLKTVSSMPLMSQYLVKPGAAMVVVSQSSAVAPPHTTV